MRLAHAHGVVRQVDVAIVACFVLSRLVFRLRALAIGQGAGELTKDCEMNR